MFNRDRFQRRGQGNHGRNPVMVAGIDRGRQQRTKGSGVRISLGAPNSYKQHFGHLQYAVSHLRYGLTNAPGP